MSPRAAARRESALPTARNSEIAAVFDETADLLGFAGENSFRIRACRNAARLSRGLKQEAADMLPAGLDLAELPGIGGDLAGRIREVIDTGSTEILRRLQRQLPHSIVELLRVPGLGPKRAELLHDRLGVNLLTDRSDSLRAPMRRRLRGPRRCGPRALRSAVREDPTRSNCQ